MDIDVFPEGERYILSLIYDLKLSLKNTRRIVSFYALYVKMNPDIRVEDVIAGKVAMLDQCGGHKDRLMDEVSDSSDMYWQPSKTKIVAVSKHTQQGEAFRKGGMKFLKNEKGYTTMDWEEVGPILVGHIGNDSILQSQPHMQMGHDNNGFIAIRAFAANYSIPLIYEIDIFSKEIKEYN